MAVVRAHVNLSTPNKYTFFTAIVELYNILLWVYTHTSILHKRPQTKLDQGHEKHGRGVDRASCICSRMPPFMYASGAGGMGDCVKSGVSRTASNLWRNTPPLITFTVSPPLSVSLSRARSLSLSLCLSRSLSPCLPLLCVRTKSCTPTSHGRDHVLGHNNKPFLGRLGSISETSTAFPRFIRRAKREIT